MKDVVAFHNAYGGIIISGVDDKTREVVGDNSVLDVDDMKKRLASATGAEIEIRFQRRNLSLDGGGMQVGMLFIPQRTNPVPLAFKADAKTRTATEGSQPESKKAYKKGVYLRKEFNLAPSKINQRIGCSSLAVRDLKNTPNVEDQSDLARQHSEKRDAQFITFVGREKELSELWRWLSDPYALIKVVSGYGGLGKTTLGSLVL